MASASHHDRALVDAVLSGDVNAYRALVERESRSVVGLCTQILGNPDDAQDVAQDAFVHAYRSLAGYRGEGSFGAWIGRIATRMAIARAAAGKRLPLDHAGLDLGASDEHGNPERRLVRREHSEAIRRAIDSLPAEQREVVALRFYQDMSIDRIAATTRSPVGTVKSRLHRALSRLRDQTDLRPMS